MSVKSIIRDAMLDVIKDIEKEEKENNKEKRDFEKEKNEVQEMSDFLMFLDENKLWKKMMR